jgi:membrane AbrB-like protein
MASDQPDISGSPPGSLRGVLHAILAQIGIVAAAALGGWAAAWIGIAAPWLSGALILTVVLGAFGLSPPLDTRLRDLAMLLAGVSMGAAVTPEAIASIARFPVSLFLLAMAIVAILAASTAVLVRFAGWPLRDAFFASAPGSLTAVLLIAASVRADVARIALLQTCRVFVLVMFLPTIITVIEPASPITGDPAPVSAAGLGQLFAAAFLGAGLFHRMRVAGPLIMGGMAGSAVLTGSGLVAGGIPPAIGVLGFVLIGVFIGQRFRGVNLADLARILPAVILSLVTTLVVALLFVLAVILVVDVEFGPAAVAFAPGGLEAMTVLAVALGLDPLYVSVHHLFRFVFVASLVSFILKIRPDIVARGIDQ